MEANSCQLTLISHHHSLTADACHFSQKLRESLGFFSIAMRDTAFKDALTFLPIVLHLLLELFSRSLAQSQFLEESLLREILQMLSDSPHGLHQLSLIILLVDFKRA